MAIGSDDFHVQVREPPGKFASAALLVKPTGRPLEIAVRPVPVAASQLVVVEKSYVGLTVGWLLSGIQAIVPTGSVVTKPPSPTGLLLRNQPSVAPSPSARTPGRPV